MSLQRRIERMEENMVTESSTNEACRVVKCLLEIGAIDPVEDAGALIRQYAVAGRTMRSILDEIDGASRGLPSQSELKDTEKLQQ
jgi:hypothetical protein